MAKEQQVILSDKDIIEVLNILEEEGRKKWLKRWQDHIAIPENLKVKTDDEKEQEKILRYLILRTLINQQAKIEKVKKICRVLVENFGETLLFEPYNISEKKLFEIFKNVAGEKGGSLYRVGFLRGIKPLSLFAYRFKAYEGFIRWLKEDNLTILEIVKKYLLHDNKPFGLFNFFTKHSILNAGWVGTDPKACRMLVNWILFILKQIWEWEKIDLTQTLMIVDGHVAKVFCRAGILKEVLYEERRPYIIEASKMRKCIEEIVQMYKKIPFYVDNGAFYLFEDEICLDLNPKCEACLIERYCKKYIKWTAYKMFRAS